MIKGAAQPCRLFRISTTSSTPKRVNPTSIRCAGRSAPPMSSVSEPQRRALGHLSRPAGLKRYRCKEKGCKRTFNDLTGTLLDGSKRSVMHWVLATFLLCLSCSSRRIARRWACIAGPAIRWCWWLRNAALSYEMHRQLEGTVEADDLYCTNLGASARRWQEVVGASSAWAP